MEYSRDEHGKPIPMTDTYGNPIQTDEYGNPMPATQGYGVGAGVAGKEQHHGGGGITGMLHRSGSSSSSSVSSSPLDLQESYCSRHRLT